MRLNGALGASCCMLLLLSGCGSSNYSDQLHAAVSDMARVIATWNGASPSDLTQTASACQKAASDLGSLAAALRPDKAPQQYRDEASALNNAHSLAHAGFADCARAARTLDYPLMTQALNELSRANGWIQKARASDRS